MINSAFDGVLFKLHDSAFAIDALKVREVVGGAVWTQAEEEEQDGSIQVRGRVIPVIDLRRLFGFPSLEKNGMNSFIAVQIPGSDRQHLVALWVDTLLDMVHLAPGELKAVHDAGTGIPANYLQAVIEKDGANIFVLRTDDIVREEFSSDQELDKAAS